MSKRMALVIGSQCAALKSNLSFLPGLSNELYELFTDPSVGGCCPSSSKLILDPTVACLKATLKAQFELASSNEATLIVAYTGHGIGFENGGDFYLLPTDADPASGCSDAAVHLTQKTKELCRRYSSLKGLVVIIDACSAGLGVLSSGQHWMQGLGGKVGYDFLSSTTDLPAYDGIFTRSLIDVLRRGLENRQTYLLCSDLRGPLEAATHPRQLPLNAALNPGHDLYVAKNVAYAEVWRQSRFEGIIEEKLNQFEPGQAIHDLASFCEEHRMAGVAGVAGAGKTTLVSALATPRLTPSRSLTLVVKALVLLDEGTRPPALWLSVIEQLDRTYKPDRKPFAEQAQCLLKKKSGEVPVLLIFDAIDQLPDHVRKQFLETIWAMWKHPELSNVHYLLTARNEHAFPDGVEVFYLDAAPEKEIDAYLQRGGLDQPTRQKIITRAEGNWLVAKCFLAHSKDHDSGTDLPLTLEEFYDDEIARTVAYPNDPAARLLEWIAIAGAGSTVPLLLLDQMQQSQAGLHFETTRAQLDRLGRLLTKTSWDDDDHADVGCFHPTLSEFVSKKYVTPAKEYLFHRLALSAIHSEPIRLGHHLPRSTVNAYGAGHEAEHIQALIMQDTAAVGTAGKHERAAVYARIASLMEVALLNLRSYGADSWLAWAEGISVVPKEIGDEQITKLVSRFAFRVMFYELVRAVFFALDAYHYDHILKLADIIAVRAPEYGMNSDGITEWHTKMKEHILLDSDIGSAKKCTEQIVTSTFGLESDIAIYVGIMRLQNDFFEVEEALELASHLIWLSTSLEGNSPEVLQVIDAINEIADQNRSKYALKKVYGWINHLPLCKHEMAQVRATEILVWIDREIRNMDATMSDLY